MYMSLHIAWTCYVIEGKEYIVCVYIACMRIWDVSCIWGCIMYTWKKKKKKLVFRKFVPVILYFRVTVFLFPPLFFSFFFFFFFFVFFFFFFFLPFFFFFFFSLSFTYFFSFSFLIVFPIFLDIARKKYVYKRILLPTNVMNTLFYHFLHFFSPYLSLSLSLSFSPLTRAPHIGLLFSFFPYKTHFLPGKFSAIGRDDDVFF